jgi:TolB-like protein/DNA-binding winged helix-turn-helix (wHTH) protein/Flp pilus assembly protein TadD
MSVQFGGFTLDVATRELRRGESLIHVSPKGFLLLLALASARPAALSKKELQQQLWPDTFVSETNLATLIAEIRAALGDDAQKPKFVRTVYGYGYAFCGEAAEAAGAPAVLEDDTRRSEAVGGVPHLHPLTPNTGRRGFAAGVFTLVAVTVVGAAGSLSYFKERPTVDVAPRAIRSLAVLPFRAANSNVDDELGFGLSDLLITRLSNVKSLTVRPTSSIVQYATSHRSAVDIGRDLRVDAVLEGNIRRLGRRVRVTAQAVDVHTGATLWADSFDENFADMFVVEDSISQRVATALASNLNSDERTRLSRIHTTDSEAFQLYIAARYQMFNRSREGRLNAVTLLERAIDKYPRYALAYAALADTLAGSAVLSDGDSKSISQKARAAALKAIEIDPSLSEAHSANAVVMMTWDRDWAGAEREFQIARDLNPSNVWAQRWHAWQLQSLRRFDEAVIERSRAVELDPLSPAIHREAAWTFYMSKRPDEAVKEYNVALAMDPNFAQAFTGRGCALLQKGDFDEAIASITKATQLAPDNRNYRGWLVYAYARAGRDSEARTMLAAMKNDNPSLYHVAAVQTALGEKGEALTSLESACKDNVTFMNVNAEPAFDSLRSEPRFAAVLRCAGFN